MTTETTGSPETDKSSRPEVTEQTMEKPPIEEDKKESVIEDNNNGSNATETKTYLQRNKSSVPKIAGKTTKKKPPGELDPKEYEIEDNHNDFKELILEDTSGYSVTQRNDLFQKGLDFEKEGKQDLALKCYLSCLKGLKNKTRFVLLPECLKNIADIYQAKEEYGNAIHFAQAEKLFYETALIETQEIQKKIEQVTGNLNIEDAIPQDLNDLNLEAMKAEEYEHLAKLCSDNKQPQLALEYAGKSAKIRQQIYGSNHVKTRETLDLFASLYAEVGKEQYSDSIDVLAEYLESGDGGEEATVVPEVIQSNPVSAEPVSILRHRSNLSQKSDKKGSTEVVKSDKEKKQVRFHESVDETLRRKKREEFVSLAVTLLLLAVCFLILFALGVWLYCSLDKGRPCSTLEARFRSWIMTIRYYFNRLTSATSPSSHRPDYSR